MRHRKGDQTPARRAHIENRIAELGTLLAADAADVPVMAELAAIADDVTAGRIKLPPRWKLDRPSPDVQVWTTPSGRRYACDPDGTLMPLPGGEEFTT